MHQLGVSTGILSPECVAKEVEVLWRSLQLDRVGFRFKTRVVAGHGSSCFALRYGLLRSARLPRNPRSRIFCEVKDAATNTVIVEKGSARQIIGGPPRHPASPTSSFVTRPFLPSCLCLGLPPTSCSCNRTHVLYMYTCPIHSKGGFKFGFGVEELIPAEKSVRKAGSSRFCSTLLMWPYCYPDKSIYITLPLFDS